MDCALICDARMRTTLLRHSRAIRHAAGDETVLVLKWTNNFNRVVICHAMSSSIRRHNRFMLKKSMGTVAWAKLSRQVRSRRVNSVCRLGQFLIDLAFEGDLGLPKSRPVAMAPDKLLLSQKYIPPHKRKDYIPPCLRDEECDICDPVTDWPSAPIMVSGRLLDLDVRETPPLSSFSEERLRQVIRDLSFDFFHLWVMEETAVSLATEAWNSSKPDESVFIDTLMNFWIGSALDDLDDLGDFDRGKLLLTKKLENLKLYYSGLSFESHGQGIYYVLGCGPRTLENPSRRTQRLRRSINPLVCQHEPRFVRQSYWG